MEFLIKSIVFMPLIAAIYVGLNTARISVVFAQLLTSGATVLAAIFAWIVFGNIVSGGNSYNVYLADWVGSGDFVASWALKVDSLTAIMLTLVTTVSSLVHIYSIGYMSHDEHRQRFMAYLSLFTFFMLMLVTSNNLLQLFLGWEGVGLASYLLIGFWYKKPSANAAAMKAFLVNRVGDIGLALGLFAIYIIFGSISFEQIFNIVGEKQNETISVFGTDYNAITAICVLLFIGCMGKSAQLGLHTWLPDAMEGPTPVSALIHAATMVTAGIFLVARMSPLFELSETALAMVTIVGATTAIFAATIAVTQNDIKKIIAYSTCSQLGYMFFACGVSAYAAGIFHLYTHGFFKALLFLGAGSVIHAMSDEQDIRKMGGIWNKIPLTYAMMIIGTLAITGFPYLSGYFSKDMILESAYAASEYGKPFAGYAFWLGIAAAFLTAFYSWRLIILAFHGKSRANKKVQDHVHESPKVMTVPLIVLALGAVFAGGIFSKSLHITHEGLSFWNGSVMEGFVQKGVDYQIDVEKLEKADAKGVEPKTEVESKSIYTAAHEVPTWVVIAPMVVGLLGFVIAILSYIIFPKVPDATARIFSPIYKLLSNKYYIDEIYDFIFVRPARKIGSVFWKFVDAGFIDRFGPNGFAYISDRFGQLFKMMQTGYVYHYSFVMLLGIILLIGYFVF
jgi:NADH-quinone oxidoreductase subunit L